MPSIRDCIQIRRETVQKNRAAPFNRRVPRVTHLVVDIGVVVDLLQRLQHRYPVGEDTVRQEERVEEVDGEKAEICETLQQTLGCGVPDVWHLQAHHNTTPVTYTCLHHLLYQITVSSYFQTIVLCMITDLAGVEGSGEANVHIVLEELWVVLDEVRHRDGGSVGYGTPEQVVEVYIVQTLEEKTYLATVRDAKEGVAYYVPSVYIRKRSY